MKIECIRKSSVMRSVLVLVTALWLINTKHAVEATKFNRVSLRNDIPR